MSCFYCFQRAWRKIRNKSNSMKPNITLSTKIYSKIRYPFIQIPSVNRQYIKGKELD